jgi:hypothetical protein
VLLLAAAAVAAWKLDLIGRVRTYQTDREREQIIASFNTPSNAPSAQPEQPNINVPTTGTDGWSEQAGEHGPLPDKVLLDVQFVPQGPLDPGPAHWAVHAESCEEAAALMAHNYLVNRRVTMQAAEDEIFAMVDWQVEHFGDEHDVYADETVDMIRGFYGHDDVRVLSDVSIDDIKRELAAGRPVIVPAIAAPLRNPRYHEQGYHMFVLVGYTADRFIANDNGTTWGEDYPYPYDDLMEALGQAGGDVVVIHS